MKREDVDQLMRYLHDAFPRLTVEQIALYSRLLEQESDTEAASKAVLRGILEWKYPPSYADLHEYVKAQKKLSEPEREHREPVRFDRTMPNWMREYVCARFLFARFGREQDLRPFPEQHPGGPPPDMEMMPPDEWAEEAAQINLTDAWRALRSSMTGGEVTK